LRDLRNRVRLDAQRRSVATAATARDPNLEPCYAKRGVKISDRTVQRATARNPGAR